MQLIETSILIANLKWIRKVFKLCQNWYQIWFKEEQNTSKLRRLTGRKKEDFRDNYIWLIMLEKSWGKSIIICWMCYICFFARGGGIECFIKYLFWFTVVYQNSSPKAAFIVMSPVWWCPILLPIIIPP